MSSLFHFSLLAYSFNMPAIIFRLLFQVPTRHTLYLPGGIIHCNDYLKGTWRTMLSDEADIDHVHIVRSRRKGAVTEMEHFVFTFQS